MPAEGTGDETALQAPDETDTNAALQQSSSLDARRTNTFGHGDGS